MSYQQRNNKSDYLKMANFDARLGLNYVFYFQKKFYNNVFGFTKCVINFFVDSCYDDVFFLTGTFQKQTFCNVPPDSATKDINRN